MVGFNQGKLFIQWLKIFCPGDEALWIIVASPSCTLYQWGSLIVL